MASNPATRGLRDEATVGPDPSRARDLKRLSELRYDVADGEPDIRGWAVFASTGREIGIVSDLLVDADAGEVVMLDIDLRRHDQHTFAPIRAAWIDHATRRVVLDARALYAPGTAPGTDSGTTSVATASAAPVADPAPALPATTTAPDLPALPRSGPLSDADIERFNADYVRAYGERAADGTSAWRVMRGTDDALQFAPRRLLEPTDPALAAPASAPIATPARASVAPPTPARDPAAGGVDTGIDTGVDDRRASRVDDASALDDSAAIDPRELDARVRIDEGGTVDDEAPVAGVRYEGAEHTPHDYGQPDDAYGPGHGSGRIGFDKVVSRDDTTPDASAAADAAAARRAVRYRRYEDNYAGPDAPR